MEWMLQVMRGQLPTLELDSVFEAKEELALAVKNALADTMTGYGYQIVQVLITDLDPDQRVKNAMNEINSSKRLKFAIAERAEGDKILQVKAAEAEAESKYLSGVGVAKQRKAIVDGLRTSIVDFASAVDGAGTKDVMGKKPVHAMAAVSCLVKCLVGWLVGWLGDFVR